MQTIRLHTGKKIVVNTISSVRRCFMSHSTIRSKEYGRHYLGAYTLGQAKPEIRFEVCIEYVDKNNRQVCIYDAVESFTTNSDYLKSIGYEI